MKLLTLTNLYPNSEQPSLGIFVEQRLRLLLQTGAAQSKVIAPVPWFPFKHEMFGQYGQFARVPKYGERYGVEIEYARYPLIPKIGMDIAPALMARALLPRLRRIVRRGYDFDLIDAHYFYPDGVAAARMAKQLGKPCVITARGSDINVIAEYPRPRRQIVDAANQCAAVITVSDALRERLIDFGVDKNRVHVLRNGVDLRKFQPADKDAAKRQLGLNGKVLLSVGRLVALKGHHIAIAALTELPDCTLVIIGDGPKAAELQQLAHKLNVAERVVFVRAVDHAGLSVYFNAAEVTLLMSSNEGMPNVLLESMACGTPVIATAVGGVPEVVDGSAAGIMIKERNQESLLRAVNNFFLQPQSQSRTREYAEQFDWDVTVNGLLELFASIIKGKQA